MSKSKSSKGIVILLAVVLSLAVVGVCLWLFWPKDKNANAVMECSINPNVQFVLNKNNEVVSVNCLNDDAQTLLCDVNFEGKKADDAAQLFVKLSTEAGYINLNTSYSETDTHRKVSITLSCDSNVDMSKIQEKIVTKVNKYFDDNGIIAGAVATINNDLQTAVKKIGLTASDLTSKTTDEILKLYGETSKELDEIALSLQSDFFVSLKSFKTSLNFDVSQQLVVSLSAQLDASQSLPESVKSALKEQLEKAKSDLAKLQKKLDKMIDEEIERLQNLSKSIFEQAKTTLKSHIEATKSLISTHNEYFKQHQAEIEQLIKDYRASLVD